ncbi:ATP-dependent RecD-like DNA helicase OS=Streptomyces tendae OX=1932 GN=recD2 PE=3 SV=1 [Streptomyces tendae]
MDHADQPPAAPGERRLTTLEGVLERVHIFPDEENGYTVAGVDTGRGAKSES